MQTDSSQPTEKTKHFARVVAAHADSALLALIITLPNLLVLSSFALHPNNAGSTNAAFSLWPSLAVWLLVNAFLVAVLLIFRRHILQPVRAILHQAQHLRAAYHTRHLETPRSSISLLNAAHEFSGFVGFAMEQYQKQQDIIEQLDQSRQVIARFTEEQATSLGSTNREIASQYRTVLAYAHYLEEQILSKKIDPTMR
jgi:hypothetical protein